MNKRFFASLVVLFAAGPASAFTLVGNAPANLNGWAGEELVFDYNLASCAGLASDTVLAAIKDAMAIWNAVPDSRMTVKLGASTSATPAQAYGLTFTGSAAVIACDPNFNTTASQAGNNGVLGIGKAGYTAGASNFTAGSMILNADTTNSPTTNIGTISTTQLTIVIAHEMGHVLGFGHSPEVKALMYFNISTKTHATLAQDDMDAMAWLYPRTEPSGGVLGCGTISAAPFPGGGNGPWSGIALVAFWFVLIPAIATGRMKRFARFRAAHPSV